MKYVIFPGTPGNYIDTPDINLLDADTAHLQQSRGGWEYSYGTTGSGLVSDSTVEVGDNALSFPAAAGTGQVWLRPSIATGGTDQLWKVPVTPGAQVTLAYRVKSAMTSREWNPTLHTYDDTGARIGQTSGSAVTIDGDWQIVAYTYTVASGVYYVAPEVNVKSGAAVTDGIDNRLDWAIIRTGTSLSFVPSLRIVGDLEAEATINMPAHTGDWRAFISTAFSEDGFLLRQEQASPVAGLLYADGTWRTGESTDEIPVDEWTTINAVAELGVEYRFMFNGIPAGIDAIDSNPGLPSGKDLTIGAWMSQTGPEQSFIGNMTQAFVRDGVDGPIVASFDVEDIVLP